MISLKQHNNIIEKLLKQIEKKDSELKQVNRILNKQSIQAPQTQSSLNEINLNKKINQLNKEYKDKINTLNQQLRNKSLENKQLKQKFTAQKNIEAKEKNHASQVFKRNFERKPTTAHDHKVAAMITHYEDQISKKNQHIKNLHKQIKEFKEDQEQTENNPSLSKNQDFQNEDQHPRNKRIEIHVHQKQLAKVHGQVAKYKRMFDQRTKQCKQLNMKYDQLMQQYYRILNQYNQQPKISKIPSQKHFYQTKLERNNYASNNLDDEQPQPSYLSSTFQSGLHKLNFDQGNNSSAIQISSQTYIKSQINNNEEQEGQLNRIIKTLGLQNSEEIIPYILKIRAKLGNIEIYDLISKAAQQFLSKLGMGKISLSQIPQKFKEAMARFENTLQNADLLDQICIQAGAKKAKLSERIKDLKCTQQEYFKSMKNIKFVKQLPKANKVREFIEYFDLSEQDVTLPDQLKKMYEQLKYFNRFIKQASTILDRQPAGIQNTLQSILRHLQKTRVPCAQNNMANTTKINKK